VLQLCLLNEEVLAKEVASGFLIDNVLFLLINELNQSGPAKDFSIQVDGILRPTLVAN
jgi:hypothetical protein